MDLQLTGKRAVVTGASRGIGLATVEALVAEGVRVVAGSRTVSAELAATGAIPVTTDLRTADGVNALVERAIVEFGDIDLLVNNVGGADHVEHLAFADTTDDDWFDLLNLNLMAAVRTTRASVPSLLRTKGVVVTVSSDGALTPRQGALATPLPYAVSKAALNACMKALSVELGLEGIRVTTVSPGSTRTSLWEGEVGETLARAAGVPHDALLKVLPEQAGMLTGRWIEPKEIAAAIAFVASPLSGSTIGANFEIDAGARRSL
ncbi:SDR family oxidoreductase [Amycolatopsis jejuensis]|uniref:SDR family oxidoreductase n=1 Tax=Amycolatopsis jejuensis TaxID=330084 RepID=UPI000526352C|nr:SDR family oxidoreductase [Amycolatopsis jejuensis]